LIGIIGYGMGNLRSVLNALEHLGAPCAVVDSPQAACDAEKLVLPGVGAFGEAMRRLDELGFAEALPSIAHQDTPLLGICLGMQLLADGSSEHGEHPGLGLIPGQVERIEVGEELRVPHVGWNSLAIRRPSRLFEGLSPDASFYFVHSYELRPAEDSSLTGTTDYGAELTATVERDSVFGVQFHPEKSQVDGLAVLRNFVAL
jgi:glutamine amidotransferase